MQKGRNSNALALVLRVFCIEPYKYSWCCKHINYVVYIYAISAAWDKTHLGTNTLIVFLLESVSQMLHTLWPFRFVAFGFVAVSVCDRLGFGRFGLWPLWPETNLTT